MGKKLSILKYGFLTALVVGVAGTGGYFAAMHYHATMAVVQEKKDAQLAEQKAKRLEQEAREKEREARLHPNKKSAVGDADSLDEAGTLEQEMEQKVLGDGTVMYSYGAPSSDGIYLMPYIVRTETGATLYVSVRHLGTTPQGFQGVDIQPDEDTTYQIRPDGAQVVVSDREGGITEQFDKAVDVTTYRVLRRIGETTGGGVKIIFPRAGGSNDDRLLTSIECQQMDHILQLYQILKDNPKAGLPMPEAASDDDGDPFAMPPGIEGDFQTL